MGKSGQQHVSVSLFADNKTTKPDEMEVGLTPETVGTLCGRHLITPIPQNSSSYPSQLGGTCGCGNESSGCITFGEFLD